MSYLLLFFLLSNYSGCISDNLQGFCFCRNQGAPPSSPPSSPSPTPSDIEVRPAKYPCISCVAQIGYVVAQVAVHVQFTPPSGLCFAGVLINFRSSKFQALDMSFFSKGHAGFFREFWHDLCQNMQEISSGLDFLEK